MPTPSKAASPYLEDLLASFQRDLRAADKAERTIEIYSQSVTFFVAWLADKGRPATLDQLTKPAISAWLADLAGRVGSGTVLTRFKGMRRFTRWLLAEGEVDADPMANLEQPKPASTPVPILTDAEVSALLKTTEGTDYVKRRDHAMLRVLFDCGVRISELASLTVDDVDFDHDVLHVVGKGRKPRAVPFGAKTARALDRYLRARRTHRYADEARLWLGERGALGRDGIDHILRVRAEQAGIEGVHAHRFRHTFAHNWLAAGGQERDLMRLAGWNSDAMLSRYGASAADERARDAHKRMRLGDRV